MVRAVQLSSTMNYSPPVDQRIVDEYFRLVSQRKTKDIAWLFGLIATYGLTPQQLSMGWSWSDDSILLQDRKRSVRPLHPQWVVLFNLKEKQPHKELQSCWEDLCSSLYKAIAYQEIGLNVTDLILAYRIRKDYAKTLKPQKRLVRSFAGVS
jgi:hypothetical protein